MSDATTPPASEQPSTPSESQPAGPADGKPKKKHSNALLYAIIFGVAMGIVAGLVWPAGFDPETGEQISKGILEIEFLGHMFLNMLFMVVVPLVMSSMIVGIGSLGDIRRVGRIGKVTVLFYLCTTVIAVAMGIGLAASVRPGIDESRQTHFLAETVENPTHVRVAPGEPREYDVTIPEGVTEFRIAGAAGMNLTLTRATDETRKAGNEIVLTATGEEVSDDEAFDPAGTWRLVVSPGSGAGEVSGRLSYRSRGEGNATIRELPRSYTVPASGVDEDGAPAPGWAWFTVNVPKRPTKLTLVMTGGGPNMRVYARPGQPFARTGEAKFRSKPASRNDWSTQTLTITDSSQPQLKGGTWYIGIANTNAHESDVTLDLMLDAPAGEQSFIRPDMSLGERIWAFVKDFAERLFPKNLIHAMVHDNILPLIIFALVFGGVLTTLGPKGAPVIAFAEGVFEAIMKIVMLIMWFAPVGIFALVATKVGGTQDLAAELQKLAWYVAVVLGGLAIHAMVVLPVLLFVLTGRSPLRYAAGMGKALLTAFSTASSNATMPMTVECLIEDNKVSKKATEFVIPLGATINMDGTALYEAVAVIFMAQLLGVPLDLSAYFVISITATLAAIGAAGIPEAGTVTMVMVLLAVGLPAEAVGYILAIDWFLDRCRTTVNVWGDSVGAAVADRLALDAPRGNPDDDTDDDTDPDKLRASLAHV